MKKLLLIVTLGCMVLFSTKEASALISVGDIGETGWQNHSYTATSYFSGAMGLLVTDHVDPEFSSQLLVDNITINGALYEGFEGSTIPGTAYGDSYLTSSFTSFYGGTVYNPTQGSQMLFMDSDSYNPNTDDFGNVVDTTAFGHGAVDGVYRYIPLTLSAGDVVAFDWAFMTVDYAPYNDYAMVLFEDQQSQISERFMLANIYNDSPNPVIPEPATLSLFGLGLAGAFFRKKIA